MTRTAGSEDSSQELAKRINCEARSRPQSPYAHKYVGIARGKVIAVADKLSELLRLMDEAGVPRDQGVCIEAGANYEGPHHIWGDR